MAETIVRCTCVYPYISDIDTMYCVCLWCPWWLMNLPVSRSTAAAASQSSYSGGQVDAAACSSRKAERRVRAPARLAAYPLHSVRRGNHRLPAFDFELPVSRRAIVLRRQHLRQNAVAQSQRRIPKARQAEALKQFSKHLRAGDDDLRPPRADPGTASRSGSVIRAIFAASFRTSAVGAIPTCRRHAQTVSQTCEDLPDFAGSRSTCLGQRGRRA